MSNPRTTMINVSMLLLRLAVSLIFIQSGGLKLFGWFGGMPPNGATAAVGTLPWFAGALELAGSIFIILGLFTKVVAFILSGEMAVAYWMAHFPMGNWPIQNHGEPAFLCCFIFFFMAFFGAGEYSLDAILKNRKRI